MRKIFCCAAVVLAAFALTGCGNNAGNNKAATEAADTQASAMEVDALLAEAETLAGKEVAVEGVCTHICQHGGKRIFLMGTDDTKVIRVEAGGKVGSFKPECVNNIVRVEGRMVEDRIDEAYLTEWEQQLNEAEAEEHGSSDGAGCTAEQQARGESVTADTKQRIADFRARIADRKAKEGKEYLSFYHIEGDEYEVLK